MNKRQCISWIMYKYVNIIHIWMKKCSLKTFLLSIWEKGFHWNFFQIDIKKRAKNIKTRCNHSTLINFTHLSLQMSTKQTRIFLWAIPRSVSTAFLRAMTNRKSIKVGSSSSSSSSWRPGLTWLNLLWIQKNCSQTGVAGSKTKIQM